MRWVLVYPFSLAFSFIIYNADCWALVEGDYYKISRLQLLKVDQKSTKHEVSFSEVVSLKKMM